MIKLFKSTKRNSMNISGQIWHFQTKSYRSNDTMGNYTNKTIIASRYSDGKQVFGSSKEKLIAIITERIADKIY